MLVECALVWIAGCDVGLVGSTSSKLELVIIQQGRVTFQMCLKYLRNILRIYFKCFENIFAIFEIFPEVI